MKLKDFILTEIEAGNVFDVDEFLTRINVMQYEDGELIEPEDYKDYLDHDLDEVFVHYYFGKVAYAMEYEIYVKYEDIDEEELSR